MIPVSVTWLHLIRHFFGLSEEVPEWICAAVGLSSMFGGIVLPCAWAMAYLERKLGADFQARVGPSQSGSHGIFQSFADLIKLLQKEVSQPFQWKSILWLSVRTMALYSTVALLPLGTHTIFLDTDMSAFLPFWCVLSLALGTMLLGLSQGTVPCWLGGVRIAAQALAGAFPAMIALLCAGIRVGGFRWSMFAGSPGVFPLSLLGTLSFVFQFTAFVVFVVSGLIMLGVPPMDSWVSISDIHGGVGSRLSGRQLILFRFGRVYSFFAWSLISVVLFLGGWVLPSRLTNILSDNEAYVSLQILEATCLLAKTFLLMLLILWIAKVNPRNRIDQVTDFAWKVLSPFSLFALIGAGLVAAWSVP